MEIQRSLCSAFLSFFCFEGRQENGPRAHPELEALQGGHFVLKETVFKYTTVCSRWLKSRWLKSRWLKRVKGEVHELK